MMFKRWDGGSFYHSHMCRLSHWRSIDYNCHQMGLHWLLVCNSRRGLHHYIDNLLGMLCTISKLFGNYTESLGIGFDDQTLLQRSVELKQRFVLEWRSHLCSSIHHHNL